MMEIITNTPEEEQAVRLVEVHAVQLLTEHPFRMLVDGARGTGRPLTSAADEVVGPALLNLLDPIYEDDPMLPQGAMEGLRREFGLIDKRNADNAWNPLTESSPEIVHIAARLGVKATRFALASFNELCYGKSLLRSTVTQSA